MLSTHSGGCLELRSPAFSECYRLISSKDRIRRVGLPVRLVLTTSPSCSFVLQTARLTPEQPEPPRCRLLSPVVMKVGSRFLGLQPPPLRETPWNPRTHSHSV